MQLGSHPNFTHEVVEAVGYMASKRQRLDFTKDSSDSMSLAHQVSMPSGDLGSCYTSQKNEKEHGSGPSTINT